MSEKKTYSVYVYCEGRATVTVEAENADQAEDLAVEMVDHFDKSWGHQVEAEEL